MERRSVLNIECAVPDGAAADLRPAEVDAIVEVAYLAVAADGLLSDVEADAFVRAMLRLWGRRATAARIRRMMSAFSERLEGGGPCEAERCARVVEVARRLRRKVAREQAFKVGYVMTLSDLETNDAEFVFAQTLRKALRIDTPRADELADEVAATALDRRRVCEEPPVPRRRPARIARLVRR